jgi:predicted RNA-binding protein Jag
LSEYFNIVDYCDYFNYVNSHEEAKENAIFAKHFIKVFFNRVSNKESLLGEGYYRSNFIRTYKDTIEMLKDRELGFDSFLKCKTPVEIQEIHDHWSQIISLERMSRFNDGIKSFSNKYSHIKEYSENDIEFKLIDNVDSLSQEGTTMRHCVKTYAKGMSEGRYLIFSVKDLSNNERATLQFGNRKESSRLMSWTFEQLKGKHNSKSSERIIDSIKLFVENFLLKNDIKINITYKEWDLVKGDTEKRPGREPDLVDQQIDNVIEDMDWILDNDLPF